MIRYSSETSIDRPPADVFAALLDVGRYPKWMDLAEASYLSPGEPAVGTRGRFRMAAGPIRDPLEFVIRELEPGRRLVVDIDDPKLHWTSTSLVVPDGAGSRLTYAGEIQLRGWRRLLEPLMRGEVQAGEAREAARLKQLIEASAA